MYKADENELTDDERHHESKGSTVTSGNTVGAPATSTLNVHMVLAIDMKSSGDSSKTEAMKRKVRVNGNKKETDNVKLCAIN